MIHTSFVPQREEREHIFGRTTRDTKTPGLPQLPPSPCTTIVHHPPTWHTSPPGQSGTRFQPLLPLLPTSSWSKILYTTTQSRPYAAPFITITGPASSSRATSSQPDKPVEIFRSQPNLQPLARPFSRSQICCPSVSSRCGVCNWNAYAIHSKEGEGIRPADSH